jgi:hypothetical protein
MSDFKPTLDRELPILREIAAKAGDARLSALLIAISDEQVQHILEQRLKEGHLYSGALLIRQGTRINAVFSFSRIGGQFGLLPLSVLAVVDLLTRRVLDVSEYYLAGNADITSLPSLGNLQPEMDLTILMKDQLPESMTNLAPQQQGNSPLCTWV